MKRHFLSLLCLALLTAFTAAHADPAPAIDIHKAIAIAEQTLHDRGLAGKISIVGATLERSTMFNNNSYWFIAWSETIPGDKKGEREVGIKVKMDGEAVRLVKAPGAM